MRPSAATLSAGFHAAVLLGLVGLSGTRMMHPGPDQRPFRRVIPLLVEPRWINHHAGGGQRDVRPATFGNLPPRATRPVFSQPTAHPLNLAPRLVLQEAIALPPDAQVPHVDSDRLGSPFSHLPGPPSFGTGGPYGVGDGEGTGAGNERGPGIGGTGPGMSAAPVRTQIKPPILLYKVEPEYSEDARKVKLQGMVVLAAKVGTDGHLMDIRVVQQLGLGLDEKAVHAAEAWLFKPAMANGRPIASNVMIEVAFRLL